MMNTDVLALYGIDYQTGLARCMNNLSFYKKILGMFLEDSTFSRAQTDMENRNWPMLFSDLHELKGLCGNAAMSDLHAAVGPMVERLRTGDVCEADIVALFEVVKEAYARARLGVERALAAPQGE